MSELAAELADLYMAGEHHLPAVAKDYEIAAGHLSWAKQVESSAMQGQLFTATLGQWDNVSFAFLRMLEQTGEILIECGYQLTMIADRYAETDGIAAEVTILIEERAAAEGVA